SGRRLATCPRAPRRPRVPAPPNRSVRPRARPRSLRERSPPRAAPAPCALRRRRSARPCPFPATGRRGTRPCPGSGPARAPAPPRPLHDGIGRTEVCGDEVWLPGGVLLALDVRLVKLEIADPRHRGEPAGFADRARVAIEADGVLDPGREPEGEPARSAANV